MKDRELPRRAPELYRPLVRQPKFVVCHDPGRPLTLIPGMIVCLCGSLVTLPAGNDLETMCPTCGATYDMLGGQVHAEPEPCAALNCIG